MFATLSKSGRNGYVHTHCRNGMVVLGEGAGFNHNIIIITTKACSQYKA